MATESGGSSDGDGDGDLDEFDAFLEAKDEFLGRIEAIGAEDPEADIEMIRARNEMFKRVAPTDPSEAVKRQMWEITKREIPFITSIGRVETDYNKIAGEVSGGPDRPEITDLLRQRVNTIEKLTAGETGTEAKYRFNFDDGTSLVVESGTLYSPTAMRRAYDSVFDELPRYEGDDDDGASDAWEDLIHELKQSRLVAKEDAVGPRTAAIQSLRNRVAELPAYLSPRRAANRSGVFLDIDPSDLEENEEGEYRAEAGVLYVPSSEVEAVAEDRDISIEALRIEMDNRDLRAGTSEERGIGDGRKAYFWPLPRGDDREEFSEKLIEFEEPPGSDRATEGG